MPKRSPIRKPKKGSKKKSRRSKSDSPKLLKDLQKEYETQVKSDGVVDALRLSDDDCAAHVRTWVSTGSLELDRVLTPPNATVGGIPCGRVTEIYGPAHIGKSTILDSLFASVQRMKGVAIVIETDAGRDESYTSAIGVDTKALHHLHFKEGKGSIEAACDKAIETILWWKTNAPEVPVVLGLDALGVTPTQEEIDSKVGGKMSHNAAKKIRAACRKISGAIAGTNTAFAILNHEYKNFSFTGGGVTANKTYGGEGVSLLATVRLRLHPVKDGFLKRSDGVILGRKVGYYLEKFKMGPGFKSGQFAILSGIGIDNCVTLFDALSKIGVLQVSGSWGAVNLDGDILKFQGWYGLREKCLESPELFAKLVSVYKAQCVRAE